MEINTGDAKPIHRKPYRVSTTEQRVINDEVQSMLDNNIIVPSQSSWSSPIVLVKKKTGDIRFCIDFRKLNSVTVRDQFPLPRIDHTLDQMNGACWFTTLDLMSGFWQVVIKGKDREKTAFSTSNGLYEFTVLPFGLVNSPAVFQRLMNLVLAGVENVLVYIDDVIIYSRI